MRTTVPGVLVLAIATLIALTGPAAVASSAAGATANADDEVAESEAASEVLGADDARFQETNETDRSNETTAACDYIGLYERTIDSIVQVQLQPTGEAGQSGGLGSGFVYATGSELESENGTEAGPTNDSDGDETSYVVTNQHVVQDRETVTVEFRDGDSREGEVVGTDVYSDLAVVAVAETPDYAESLSVAPEEPTPGEPVAALGSPYGLEGTITAGIVGAVDRAIPAQGSQQPGQGQRIQATFRIPNVVQTDAAINPGNSGGPLVDCEGTVVGVNSAGLGQTLGFAIGTPMVERVVPALIGDGEYAHSYLGIRTFDVSPQVAEANDLESTHGVYVHETAPEGPTDDELQGTEDTEMVDELPVPVGGDVIVAIDGQEIRNGEELSSYLALETSPGDEVELTVLRDGEEETVTVTLEERPEPETMGS